MYLRQIVKFSLVLQDMMYWVVVFTLRKAQEGVKLYRWCCFLLCLVRGTYRLSLTSLSRIVSTRMDRSSADWSQDKV